MYAGYMGSTSNALKLKNKLTALVVDDAELVRRIHIQLLTNLGVDAWNVENGKKAVDLCHSGEVFDLILMDMEMPIMDGPEATRLLREMGVTSVIVGVSASSMEWNKQFFMDAGLNHYEEKPLSADKLVPILREIDINY
ncbi:Two-component response regulator [Thalictrum thalictroides]|uniref:Two-component response regulator n=1 Tax=Thalictrum thalictroides TaxID=46969 RepID=A0A7J6XC61_THATH|nr:Two-component response regulator [Thalictrum thalictroides]